MKSQKVVWQSGNNIFVVRKGDTSNDKISDGKPLVQTYTFTAEQWQFANDNGKGMHNFYALDGTNCMDCPFSRMMGSGGCYTHKFGQYVGFLSMLRTIKASDFTVLTLKKESDILEMCKDTYVRFGTYGEPSLLPIALVGEMAQLASSYTGYTHQWRKDWAKDFSKYFMASVHSQFQANVAQELGYRSFIATKDGNEPAVQCPASKEGGYKSNCAKCGLCSGTQGKGKMNVKIMQH